MRKITLFSILFLFGFTLVSAQIQKGNLMVGANIGSGLISDSNNGIMGFNFNLNKGGGFDLGLSPKVGYFIEDNLMVGAMVNLGFSKSRKSAGVSTKATSYGFQGLGRYYLNPGERGVNNLLNYGRFFVEANAGFAGVNVHRGATTNGFVFGFGPGYSYFWNQHVALEASFKYNGLLGGGNTTYQHSLGFAVGVQIFLPSESAKQRVRETLDEMKR